MPVAGLFVDDGRKWKAELFSEADGSSSPPEVKGIFWCAVGTGDSNFIDPENPPSPSADQITLKTELIRKLTADVKFLNIDPLGTITFNGVRYSQSTPATNLLLATWIFDFNEANFTWREIAFHGGDVTTNSGAVALNGLFPTGQVTNNGRCIYVLNVPSRLKDNTIQRPVRILITL